MHFLFFLFTLHHLSTPITTTRATNITALFAFGDSILDPGNNNHLFTIFQSNHRPYGLEFPNHDPTGRFSDGKLATDFMVSDLGLKPLLLAYLSPSLTTPDLLTGVSFASAGSGLDDSTAIEANVLSLGDQLRCFDEALMRINGLVGLDEMNRIVENAMFVIAVGSNDMLYNAYGLGMKRELLYDDQVLEYQGLLLRNLKAFVRRLHAMGARRLAIMGLPPVGCLPVQATFASIITPKRVCVKKHNVHSQSYNTKLHSLTLKLQETLAVPESRVAYVDIYTPMMDMIRRPTIYGFEKTLVGCCGIMGSVEMGPLCNEFASTCMDTSKYVFFDAAHPTQAAYEYLAKHFYHNVLPSLIA